MAIVPHWMLSVPPLLGTHFRVSAAIANAALDLNRSVGLFHFLYYYNIRCLAQSLISKKRNCNKNQIQDYRLLWTNERRLNYLALIWHIITVQI